MPDLSLLTQWSASMPFQQASPGTREGAVGSAVAFQDSFILPACPQELLAYFINSRALAPYQLSSGNVVFL